MPTDDPIYNASQATHQDQFILQGSLAQRQMGTQQNEMISSMMGPEQAAPTPDLQSVQMQDGTVHVSEKDMQDPPIDPKVLANKDDTIDRMRRLFGKYRDWRERNMEPMWEKSFKAYRGDVPEYWYPYQSIYIMKEVFRQIESLKPLIAQIMWPEGHKFEFEPKLEMRTPDALAATNIVHDQFVRFDLDKEIIKWMDQTWIWGVSYIKYGWTQYRQNKHKIDSLHAKVDQPQWKHETTEVLEEAPHLEWLNHWKVYTDPFVEELKDSPVVFIREVVTGSYLKTMVREGVFDAGEVKEAFEHVAGAYNKELKDFQRAIGYDSDELDGIDDIGEFEILTCYTNDGWEYTLLGDKHLVQGRRNPFNTAPILTLRDHPQAGEHYGLSEPWVLMHDQDFLNDLTSLWMDSHHYTSQPGWLVRKDQQKNWDYTEFRPGMSVFLDDISEAAVRPMPVNPTSPDLAGAFMLIKNNMELTTGITKEVTGSGSSTETATGIVRLQNAAGARVNHKIKQLCPVFRELYRVLYDLNARFLDSDLTVRLAGKDGLHSFQTFAPSVFEPDVDVNIILPPGLESAQERQAKYMRWWQMFGMDPRVDPEPAFIEMQRAFGFQDPQAMWIPFEQTAQSAMEDIQEHMITGLIRPATAHDNHMLHMQLLQMYMATPNFMSATPMAQQQVAARLAKHQSFLQKLMAMQGQASQVSNDGGGSLGAVQGEANGRAEAQFDNGATGAERAGMPPGKGGM